jgi:hypothetical protein
LGDPVFFDVPPPGVDPEWDRPAPAGWTRAEFGEWVGYTPDDARIPDQGWKVHASACSHNADAVLDAAFVDCVEHGIAFKFLRRRHLLFLSNSKPADRGASGKFVTIYPRDEAELEALLTRLGTVLRDQPGPYVLTDLRWEDGPLYVRYGAFVDRRVLDPNGTLLPAIADAEGRLVPDLRAPTFQLPPWVTLPEFLAPHLAARAAGTLGELPYRIDGALHFSNGGGVYTALDERSGERVVLKEARPNAGLTEAGVDAIARLEHEADILGQLAGLPAVPEVRDAFTSGGHRFLVQERAEGSTLAAELKSRHPTATTDPDPRAVADYTAWAIEIAAGVEAAVATVHERGIVIGDLNPSNVLIGPDGHVRLVDWEVAAPIGAVSRATLGAPGFAAPPGATGLDVDRFALACLRLHLFLPLTRLVALERGKAQELADEIARRFPVPPSYLSEAVEMLHAVGGAAGSSTAIGPPPAGALDGASWPGDRDSMVRAILRSADPTRDDRLFPGAIEQFGGAGGIDFATGAAGVLYALDATGAGRFPDHEDWLVRQARRASQGTPLGLFRGLHGVAYVLQRLGRSDDAHELLARCVDELDGGRPLMGIDLGAGLTGIALNLAHFAALTDDAGLRDRMWRLADEIVERVRDDSAIGPVSGGRYPAAGLMRGSSGPGLLAIRLFEESGDDGLLDVAAAALRQDLRRCVERADGTLHVDEGWRTTLYLADGTAGIGMVLAEYLRHREDEELGDALAAIRRTIAPSICLGAGLFAGRAGLLLALGHLGRRNGETTGPEVVEPEVVEPEVVGQVRLLHVHAFGYFGNLAFPGDRLLRLSMDVATGTAGVLLAMGSVLGDEPVGLPFCGPFVGEPFLAPRPVRE